MDGGAIVLWIFALSIATFWLCLYVYGLYSAGKWLAKRYRLRLRPTAATLLIAVSVLLIDIPVLPFQMEAIYKLTLMFGLWLVHAQPLAVGYWIGYEVERQRDLDRWNTTLREWVSEFEERPPDFMREFEEND